MLPGNVEPIEDITNPAPESLRALMAIRVHCLLRASRDVYLNRHCKTAQINRIPDTAATNSSKPNRPNFHINQIPVIVAINSITSINIINTVVIGYEYQFHELIMEIDDNF